MHLRAVRLQAALPRPLLHVARQPREREHEQDVRLRGRGQGLEELILIIYIFVIKPRAKRGAWLSGAQNMSNPVGHCL